jgi:hypothetical protein
MIYFIFYYFKFVTMFYILHNSGHLSFNNEPRGLKIVVMFRLKITLEHASDKRKGIMCVCVGVCVYVSVCVCVCSTTRFKFV